MNDFVNSLNSKLNKYQNKYTNDKQIMLKVLGYTIRALLSSYCKHKNKLALDKQKLNIVFDISGGMGDTLINLNYIYYFRQLVGFDNINIEVYSATIPLAAYLQEFDYVNKYGITKDNEDNFNQYDLHIRVLRFPYIVTANKNKIAKFAPSLIPILSKYEKFAKENAKVLSQAPYFDSVAKDISLVFEQKRIQQLDVGSFLNISEDYKLPINLHNENEILEKFNLHDVKFITLNCAMGNKGKTRLWPVAHYAQLVKMIKETYPNIQLVQLGTAELTDDSIANIDLNLVGKTNFEELKVLLKNSILHVDGEGGLVHLRKALHASKSIVLFGPTSKDFIGYSTNINIKAENVCKIACEWVCNDWNQRCIKTGTTENPCMQAILPEMVFEYIKEELNKYFTQTNSSQKDYKRI